MVTQARGTVNARRGPRGILPRPAGSEAGPLQAPVAQQLQREAHGLDVARVH